MKKLFITTIVLIAFGISSCSNNPKELAVAKYEETKDGIRTDMNLKIEEFDMIKTIYKKDKLNDFNGSLEEQRESAIKREKKSLEIDEKAVKRYKEIKNSFEKAGLPSSSFQNIRDKIRDHESDVFAQKLKIEHLMNTDNDSINFPFYYTLIQELKTDSLGVLWDVYKATYSINNPDRNGVKETITKEYNFKNDSIQGSRIIN